MKPSVVRPLAILGAAVLALVVYFVARAAAGELIVKTGGSEQTVTPVAVVGTVVLVGLLGWGLLALLEKLTAKGRTVWTVVAGVFLVLSLLGPLGGTDAGTKLSLALLHLLVGAVIIIGFTRAPRPA
ncbi:hypothetical protein Daura_29790 [Dactylosporangium aurantiacum]|uniref:Uncharacterized protein n=1 Tax=Dactylosporangium aurantiacum TaxID=35754 RepID=A0A9Q9MII5_9ACTN|nr:DUF6069 family protein [Dactylosporangium aurantiacum]MDG6106846.1 DUF6069 family protein [Dactylosporangium aurantiacum]UWZ50982.1 hypothetical protein Daura_29790 [Dactylosporangium aurantiacum]